MIKVYEAVGIGHPDKIADNIADRLLDNYLLLDATSRCAIEVLAGHNLITINGEVDSSACFDIKNAVLDYLESLDYDTADIEVVNHLCQQSKELSCIQKDNVIRSGDNSVVVGFATNETNSMTPVGFEIANSIVKNLNELAFVEKDVLGLDCKCLVYINEETNSIIKIVVCCQTKPNIKNTTAKKLVFEEVIKPILYWNAYKFKFDDIKFEFNPAGSFHSGGIDADTGLTGRKLVCDNYGTYIPVGGGSFSGKDCTKMDRTGAYYARYIAKHLVTSRMVSECLVYLSFKIGNTHIEDIQVDSKGTGFFSDEVISKIVKDCFETSIDQIVKNLQLFKPVFFNSNIYGAFCSPNRVYEKIDSNIIKKLKEAMNGKD